MVSDYGQILKIAVCPQRNLGVPPGIRKNPRHHGTNFNQYSVVRGHDRSIPHLHNRVSPHPPLSQAPLLGQDELTRRKRDLDMRGLSVRLHTLS